VQESRRRELLMPLPTIGYCLLPFILLVVRPSVFTSCLSVMEAPAWPLGNAFRVGSHRAFRVGQARSRAPPGYSPKTQNEPEKCFIINESTQKRTRERTRTNPGGQGPRSRKSFKVRKAFFGKLKTNPKRTRAAIQAGLVRFN
jgi:hypothetical protein